MSNTQDSTAVIYSEADLIRFGNFLFKSYGVTVNEDTAGNKLTPYQPSVTIEDMEMWKEIDKPIYDGPRFSNGSQIIVSLVLESERVSTFPATILCTHHHPGKTKYDIEVALLMGKTRMYNINESLLVPANA
jgi:hypothetical protein